ncbi:MAG: TIGR01459 family HAD-type hydrolase [Rickettsiales bacterium]|nr:TIGR01459 family HAD-type hydrolase [Rickettsiales bacterium]
MTIATYQGIRDLADAYDHWIIDLWGVLHDGATPYPGAIDTLNTLKQHGKTIILLSNAPRRAFKAEAVLESLGFDRNSYDTVITSGELTYHYLQAHTDYGKHYYYIGPPKDEDLLDDLPYVRVMEPADADFALVTGFDEFGDPIESKLPQVEHCLKYELPMVCANPDRKVVKQDGRVMLCAGLLGEWYQENGGKVQFFGKPYASAYASCMAYFGTDDTSRIIAVGDSIHTDIAGARLSNITALLVAGGILAESLDIIPGEMPAEAAINRVVKQEGMAPNGVIARFTW